MANLFAHRKRLLFCLGSFSIALLLLAFGIYLGFDLSEKLQREHSFPSRIVKRAVRGYGAVFYEGRQSQQIISTNRLDLHLSEHIMPLELKNGAGGISTDRQGGVLIVDLAGKVFRVWDGKTTRLDIVTPNSNVDALKVQLKDGSLGDIDIHFGHFRFNDILLHGAGADRSLLVSFTEWHPDDFCFTSTLAKAPIPSGAPSDWTITQKEWTIVARTRPCLPLFKTGFGIKGAEAGGRMISKSETEVLWTSGVYNRDDDFNTSYPEGALAQSDASDYGKVLLVNLEDQSIKSMAKGLRNPQGIDLGQNGEVLVTDHGMRGGDELNLINGSANFGFPLVTLGTKYSKEPGGSAPFHAGHHGFDKPIMAFVPSIAPSSVLYVHNFHPNWDGNILVGGLKRQLHRVYLEDGDVLFVEPIDLGLRIRDMGQLEDGRIVIMSDDNKLVIMEPGPSSVENERFQALLALEPDQALKNAALDTFMACLECHGLEENETGAGPTLYGVCGRKPERVGAFEYSGALGRAVDVWDDASLAEFLLDPPGTAPGTTMIWDGIGKPEVAAVLSKTLCQMSPD